MRIALVLFVAMCSLLTQGCASTDFDNPVSIQQNIKVSKDPFAGAVIIKGPEAPPTGHAPYSHASLIAEKSPSGVLYFIDVQACPVQSTVYGKRPDFMYFDSAADARGNQLGPVQVVDRWREGEIFYFEKLRIPVSFEYLNAYRDLGIILQVSSARGKMRFILMPDYVRLFLQTTQTANVTPDLTPKSYMAHT